MPGNKMAPNIRKTNTLKLKADRNKLHKKAIRKIRGPSTIDSKQARQMELAEKKEKRILKMRAKKAALKSSKMEIDN